MPWTIDEIERDWLGGEHVQLPPDDVVRAFAFAEQSRGREWVLSTTSIPGGGRQWGFASFLRVYAFGKRIQAVTGAPGADALLGRLLQNDAAAESELTAIYLLRSRRSDTVVEIGPEIAVGDRHRRPDFRIRNTVGPWTYVEATQLNRSVASARTQDVLRRIAGHVISIPQPFLLEVVFWRDPTEGEEDELVRRAFEACQAADGYRQDIGDLASLMVKSGDPAVIIPSILPKDDGTRMSFAQSIVGPDQPNRQIVVRAPFADQRAEDILTAEARQLPRDESGLVMVDVSRQPTAFESWAELVPRRFTPVQHTRVGGVLLFMTATTVTQQGLTWLPYMKLIPNPHARISLPAWIAEVVQEIRADSRRLTGRPD
ncbi:MAG: hypothetical protein ACLP3K_16075 [Candidatus Acidiferrales bacterium]